MAPVYTVPDTCFLDGWWGLRYTLPPQRATEALSARVLRRELSDGIHVRHRPACIPYPRHADRVISPEPMPCPVQITFYPATDLSQPCPKPRGDLEAQLAEVQHVVEECEGQHLADAAQLYGSP